MRRRYGIYVFNSCRVRWHEYRLYALVETYLFLGAVVLTTNCQQTLTEPLSHSAPPQIGKTTQVLLFVEHINLVRHGSTVREIIGQSLPLQILSIGTYI